jgi:hypothetical protein
VRHTHIFGFAKFGKFPDPGNHRIWDLFFAQSPSESAKKRSKTGGQKLDPGRREGIDKPLGKSWEGSETPRARHSGGSGGGLGGRSKEALTKLRRRLRGDPAEDVGDVSGRFWRRSSKRLAGSEGEGV